jgi:hypothetical protein
MIPRIADKHLCKVSCLRLGYVPFDNIDGNVDRHCLNFLFIILYHLHITFFYIELYFSGKYVLVNFIYIVEPF